VALMSIATGEIIKGNIPEIAGSELYYKSFIISKILHKKKSDVIREAINFY